MIKRKNEKRGNEVKRKKGDKMKDGRDNYG